MKSLLIILSLAVSAIAFPDGAPESTCNDLTPQHGKPGQNGQSPYKLTVSKSSVRAGQIVYVTLEAAAQETLKGFIIIGKQGNTPVGKFQPAEGVKLLSCGGGADSGATHADAKPKHKVVVAWVAPAGKSGNVVFSATPVKDGYTFWVNQKSAPVSIVA